MSTKEEFHAKLTELTREHFESVGGGLTINCSAAEIDRITSEVVNYYENLVSATSHIIERVANAVSG